LNFDVEATEDNEIELPIIKCGFPRHVCLYPCKIIAKTITGSKNIRIAKHEISAIKNICFYADLCFRIFFEKEGNAAVLKNIKALKSKLEIIYKKKNIYTELTDQEIADLLKLDKHSSQKDVELVLINLTKYFIAPICHAGYSLRETANTIQRYTKKLERAVGDVG